MVRGRGCSTPVASVMERYAPNKLELASRDVVSRAEQTEINEGRGFPDGGLALDVTYVPRNRILEALREIVHIGRDFAGVDITREPIHIRPGMHYIMGGVRTDAWGETPLPVVLRRRGVRLRVGAWRQPARRQLAARHADLRSARGPARGRAVKRLPIRELSNRRLKDEQAWLDSIIAREHGGRRVAEIKQELGETMNRHCAVYCDEQGLDMALEVVRRLKEKTTAWIDDCSAIFDQDVISVIELRLHDTWRRRSSSPRSRLSHRITRRAVPHRLPQARRRELAQAHHGHRERRGAEDSAMRP